jgi:hypothetical protein
MGTQPSQNCILRAPYCGPGVTRTSGPGQRRWHRVDRVGGGLVLGHGRCDRRGDG